MQMIKLGLRGEVPFPRPHSWEGAEPSFEARSARRQDLGKSGLEEFTQIDRHQR